MQNEKQYVTAAWRNKLHEIIFESDTAKGKLFDVVLLFFILFSVIAVMLESVADYQIKYGTQLLYLEWFFTIVFTCEYVLRLISVIRPKAYALSFFGIIDLLSILPAYLSIFLAGTQGLLVIRALRLLRVFRVLKLGQYMSESEIIAASLKASRRKIFVFLFTVVILVTIIGAIMYLVEGSSNPGFSSIPLSVYWSIVTLTTVGFGDITPNTSFGQFLSALVMIIGYAVIAVPTGIVTAEFAAHTGKVKSSNTQACRYCGEDHHAKDANYCKRCGHMLNMPADHRLSAEA